LRVDSETENKKSDNYFYACIPIELLFSKDLSDRAKLLYLIYHSYSKEKNLKKGCTCFPSQLEVSKKGSWSLRKVRQAHAELRAGGWVSVKRRKGLKTNIVKLQGSNSKRNEKT